FSPDEASLGEPTALVFQVLPPLQMVYLKFLPAFEDALMLFGLAPEREAVVNRILEVLLRDYTGISIAFQTSPPQDFAEYSIVEIGGEDPNGTGLFGLDNTSGKDVGNVRFDDVIGGFNAETRAQGYAAYGGIFASELLSLSATLSDNILARTRFDDVFGPVCPGLGGQPAALGESTGASFRAVQIQEAVRVFGNLVGSTISHEIGHSLGLTAVPGSFHNLGDNPGWLMDAGIHRPFEERAELDGQGPSVFSPDNRLYLESILPP
ncbi:MAG: hypothetical protein VYE15_03535, partial [Myxococcota bacterium]|nr:hypothetical protein [Myxococcota bacterium]